ncbi:SurA N-terminal domain-containing protein [Paenibacillus paeoniae]|uniref:SurA N-terminal domain-containing protein n=1 Tax=Paenibacillus paeoniae TaxID=2292705 RepID=UPI0014028EDE|nr:SurA N-terminal domain-containing protein [Paenibacillus paeoniae]
MKKWLVLASLFVVAVGITVFGFILPALPSEPILAQGKGIKVTAERFIDTKQNFALAQSMLGGEQSEPTDQELLEQLLISELLLSQAKSKGLTATEEEVNGFIEEQRKMLRGSDQHEMIALMDERIRLSGMDEDSFWQDKTTKDAYREAIISGKLPKHLINEGEITGWDDFASYQKKLLQANINSIKVNWDVLENTER